MVAKAKKVAYFAHLEECLKKYPRAFLVDADFVGSKQISDIRIALRGKAELLFGKNTMVRRCIRNLTEDGSHPEWEALLPYMIGNIGFVFTMGELSVVEEVVKEYVKPAAAKAGVIAPCSCTIPFARGWRIASSRCSRLAWPCRWLPLMPGPSSSGAIPVPDHSR